MAQSLLSRVQKVANKSRLQLLRYRTSKETLVATTRKSLRKKRPKKTSLKKSRKTLAIYSTTLD